MNTAPIHRLTGLGAIAAFACTGFYLKFRGETLFGGDDAARFAYRANHVYILMAGLLNVAVGLHVVPGGGPWRRRLQVAGSALLLAAPPVLIVAFFREAPAPGLVRPLTAVGILLLLLGTVLHVPARRRVRGD